MQHWNVFNRYLSRRTWRCMTARIPADCPTFLFRWSWHPPSPLATPDFTTTTFHVFGNILEWIDRWDDVILLTRFLLLIMTVYLSIGGDRLARIRWRRSDGLLVVILFESGVVEFMISRWIADLLALSSFRRIPHRCTGRKTAVILFLLERRITSTSILVDEFTTNHIYNRPECYTATKIQSFQWNWPFADVRPTSRMFSYTSVQNLLFTWK